MYNRILLPTDGSAGMQRVIEHTGALASKHDALVHALYVVDAASFASLPMETSWEGVSELLREEGSNALDEVERLIDDDVEVERVIVEGSPSRTIVEYARDDDCDLVVMGTHGRGGIDRLLLGSVAERVVRASHVPVMTVRVGETPPRPPLNVEADFEPEPEPGAR